MEMNTRLQVEHPVTEMVTNTDLVEWQLRVAAGERLPLDQSQIRLDGHAIEVRLYAENPARGFLPATGTLHRLRLPENLARVETGVREGDAVTPFYDPMIAKIVAAGPDRAAARSRLARALAQTGVLGLATNLGFLARVVADPDFADARLDTGFIERRRQPLLAPPRPIPDRALAAAALSWLVRGAVGSDAGRFSPWARRDGWRLNAAAAAQTLDFDCDGDRVSLSATAVAAGWRLQIGDRVYQAGGQLAADGMMVLTLDGVQGRSVVLDHGDETAVFLDGEGWHLQRVDPLAPPAGADVQGGRLTAPMPGRVVQLLTAAGEAVRQGQPLIVIEAMKMEHTISAPRDGTVETLRYAVGDLVEEGAELIALAETPDAA
jgi:3-methylcrotonyl-CoA carboxylase alpha subunit